MSNEIFDPTKLNCQGLDKKHLEYEKITWNKFPVTLRCREALLMTVSGYNYPFRTFHFYCIQNDEDVKKANLLFYQFNPEYCKGYTTDRYIRKNSISIEKHIDYLHENGKIQYLNTIIRKLLMNLFSILEDVEITIYENKSVDSENLRYCRRGPHTLSNYEPVPPKVLGETDLQRVFDEFPHFYYCAVIKLSFRNSENIGKQYKIYLYGTNTYTPISNTNINERIFINTTREDILVVIDDLIDRLKYATGASNKNSVYNSIDWCDYQNLSKKYMELPYNHLIKTEKKPPKFYRYYRLEKYNFWNYDECGYVYTIDKRSVKSDNGKYESGLRLYRVRSDYYNDLKFHYVVDLKNVYNGIPAVKCDDMLIAYSHVVLRQEKNTLYAAYSEQEVVLTNKELRTKADKYNQDYMDIDEKIRSFSNIHEIGLFIEVVSLICVTYALCCGKLVMTILTAVCSIIITYVFSKIKDTTPINYKFAKK